MKGEGWNLLLLSPDDCGKRKKIEAVKGNGQTHVPGLVTEQYVNKDLQFSEPSLVPESVYEREPHAH